MFIRELTTSSDPVIRNNILIILGDICKRYFVLGNVIEQ